MATNEETLLLAEGAKLSGEIYYGLVNDQPAIGLRTVDGPPVVIHVDPENLSRLAQNLVDASGALWRATTTEEPVMELRIEQGGAAFAAGSTTVLTLRSRSMNYIVEMGPDFVTLIRDHLDKALRVMQASKGPSGRA